VDRTDDQLLTLFNRLKKHHNDGWPVADGAGNNGVKQNWLKHKNLGLLKQKMAAYFEVRAQSVVSIGGAAQCAIHCLLCGGVRFN
jgi:hypothetical protein